MLSRFPSLKVCIINSRIKSSIWWKEIILHAWNAPLNKCTCITDICTITNMQSHMYYHSFACMHAHTLNLVLFPTPSVLPFCLRFIPQDSHLKQLTWYGTPLALTMTPLLKKQKDWKYTNLFAVSWNIINFTVYILHLRGHSFMESIRLRNVKIKK